MVDDWGSDLALLSHCAALSEGGSLLLQKHRYFRSSFRFLHFQRTEVFGEGKLSCLEKKPEIPVSPDLKQCWEAGVIPHKYFLDLSKDCCNQDFVFWTYLTFVFHKDFFSKSSLTIPVANLPTLVDRLCLVTCFLISVVLHLYRWASLAYVHNLKPSDITRLSPKYSKEEIFFFL